MSKDINICQVEENLKKKIQEFKMRKTLNSAAITMKIDKDEHLIVEDEEYEDVTIEDLREELPSHHPSYTLYSYVYKHDDGRVSYPLILIFVTPEGSKPELQMMYAGSKHKLIKDAQVTKIFEVRSSEELTEDWLKQKLAYFR